MLRSIPYENGVILASILILWIVYAKRRKWLERTSIIIIFVILGMLFLDAIIPSAKTYYLWKSDSIAKFLLPSYQKGYFYHYCFFHYFFKNLIAVTIAFLVGLGAWVLSKKGKLARLNVWLIVMAVLMSGLIVISCLRFLPSLH